MADVTPPLPPHSGPPPPPPHPVTPPPGPPHGAAHALLTEEFRKLLHLHRNKVLDDFKVLQTHLLLPFRELFTWSWLKDKKLLSIMALGLFPLAVQTVFVNDVQKIYWCLGFYFSMLWALFFYHFFQPPGVTRTYSAMAFWGTGLVSMAVLFFALHVGLEKLRDPLLASSSTAVQAFACIFLVGVPEELCKAAVILFLLYRGPKVPSVPMMVFYGLMSGLGFGIYEGMQYQMGKNLNDVESATADNMDVAAAAYYFNNMLRLTTLPFLHAMWTAIGAYFWSLGRLYPRRRYGLWVTALAIPATLHGLHDTYVDTEPYVALAIDFISVYLLMIYLSTSQKLEHVLQDEGVVEERATVVPGATMPVTPPPIPPKV
jgi:RsiW-degrading membrane proteinase PrsW (M82 family)